MPTQTDAGSGSLLPEWLADAPPWLQLIALFLAAGAAVLIVYAATLAPALAARIRGRETPPTPPETGSTEAPAGSPTRPSAPAPPEERYDAKMAVIERLLKNVETDQERDRQVADRLTARIAQLEADVRTRDATIAELRRTIDQLVGRPQQGPTTPPWPDRRPGRSFGS